MKLMKRIVAFHFIFSWIIILIFRAQAEIHGDDIGSSCQFLEDAETNFCEEKQSRYLIYNVNQGEGFNLRRDVYVRIAPLVHKLNTVDKEHRWILALPPWSNMPHWSTRKVFSWSTFFQLDKINEYIPAIEFEDFMDLMDDYGVDKGVDAVFQLQHFPFDQNTNWKDKIEFGVECHDSFPYQLEEHDNGNRYVTTLWNQRIFAKKAECMALRGTSSTLMNFLLQSKYRTILFEHAEVILWDSYGDQTWWKARRSLQFAIKLQEIAATFLKNHLPEFNLTHSKDGNLKAQIFGNSFIGVHLRRRDFLHRHSDSAAVPTIRTIAAQIYNIMQMLEIYKVFIASDTFPHEIQDLKSELISLATDETNDAKVPILFQHRNLDLSEGEIAIVDQIVCSWSTYFVGTKDSTFTIRIFEEREILGCFDPTFTFNSFCSDVNKPQCEQPTQWRVI